MDGGVSGIEQEMSNSIDGARAHDEPHAPQELKKWVSNLKKLLHRQFPDLTEPPEALIIEDTKNYDLSIYPSDCSPKMFEIGVHVYNYGCDRKDPMWRYASFMHRWHDFKIEPYLEYMRRNENRARRYFEETDERHLVSDSNRFLEYLMVGSCFLGFAIVLLQNITIKGIEILKGSDDTHDLDLKSKQFKLLNHEIMLFREQTKLDMLNLGNQIPWFAVEKVFYYSDLRSILGGDFMPWKKNFIVSLAISCLDGLYPRANQCKVNDSAIPSGEYFRHLLHIFHWTRTPELDLQAVDILKLKIVVPRKPFSEFNIPSATVLLKSATLVKQLDGGSCEVEYTRKRISALMQIAPLHICAYSEKIFSDLLIFEQRYLECGLPDLPVTAYIACMKNLVQADEDVKLLQKNGVVQNPYKERKDVLEFVHNLEKYLSKINAILPSYLTLMSKEITDHHQRRLGRNYAELKSQFCPNRWVIFTIIVSTILFALTFIQTIYTALGYYKT